MCVVDMPVLLPQFRFERQDVSGREFDYSIALNNSARNRIQPQRGYSRGAGGESLSTKVEAPESGTPTPFSNGDCSPSPSDAARLYRRRSRPHRPPQQHGTGHENGWEDHLVDRVPAEFFEQLTRRKRTQRHAAEDQEVIKRLNLVALVRPMALRHHGGCADEGQVPSE